MHEKRLCECFRRARLALKRSSSKEIHRQPDGRNSNTPPTPRAVYLSTGQFELSTHFGCYHICVFILCLLPYICGLCLSVRVAYVFGGLCPSTHMDICSAINWVAYDFVMIARDVWGLGRAGAGWAGPGPGGAGAGPGPDRRSDAGGAEARPGEAIRRRPPSLSSRLESRSPLTTGGIQTVGDPGRADAAKASQPTRRARRPSRATTTPVRRPGA